MLIWSALLFASVVVNIPDSCGIQSIDHQPLYQHGPHLKPTVLRSTFFDKVGSGYDVIKLHVVQGQLATCDSLPNVGKPGVPCSLNDKEDVYDLVAQEGQGVMGTGLTVVRKEVELPAGSLVTYWFDAKTRSGCEVMSEKISFSVAARGSEEEYGSLNGELIPVWWHRSDADSKIDIAFLPARYQVADYGLFVEKAVDLVGRVFFNGIEPAQSCDYTDRRHHFNLWLGPYGVRLVEVGARPELGVERGKEEILQRLSSMDARVLLHSREPVGHWAQVSLGGDAGLYHMSNPNSLAWAFIHESGHFLHGQADEYCCNDSKPIGKCPNVFSSLDDCRNRSGVVQCRSLIKERRYRDEESKFEAMALKGLTFHSEWGSGVQLCLEELFANCSKGSCYPQALGVEGGGQLAAGNAFDDLKPSIVLTLVKRGDQYFEKDMAIRYGLARTVDFEDPHNRIEVLGLRRKGLHPREGMPEVRLPAEVQTVVEGRRVISDPLGIVTVTIPFVEGLKRLRVTTPFGPATTIRIRSARDEFCRDNEDSLCGD